MLSFSLKIDVVVQLKMFFHHIMNSHINFFQKNILHVYKTQKIFIQKFLLNFKH